MCMAALLACAGPDEIDGGAYPEASLDARTWDAHPERCTRDSECDDAIHCNGAETCRPGDPSADGSGCVAGVQPCGAGEECDEMNELCVPEDCSTPDADGDGYASVGCGGDDCDDGDPLRFAGNTESCDALDRDEDCDPSTFGNRDSDGDGFVDAACCNGTVCGNDCNDGAAGIHPTASEVCDGLDNDCDGSVDEAVRTTFFLDADGDGYGQPTSLEACAPMGMYTATTDDDCDDTEPAAHPGATEVCDEFDNDCDLRTDEGTRTVFFRDADGDMFGDDAASMERCLPLGDFTATVGGDCDDGEAGVNPGAPETCDGVDTDCRPSTWAVGEDDDGDGVADIACGGTDCDDEDPLTFPGAPEPCNGVDNDCSGDTEDPDGDGFVATTTACMGGPYPPTDCWEGVGGGAVNPSHRRFERVPYCANSGFPCEHPDGSWDCRRGFSPLGCTFDSRTGAASWDWNCDGVDQAEPPWTVPASCSAGLCSASGSTGFCADQGFTSTCGFDGQGPIYSGSPPPCGASTPYGGCCCGSGGDCGGLPRMTNLALGCR